MTRFRRLGFAVTALALVTIGAGCAAAAGDSGAATHGKAILEKNCARCHAIGATDKSPLEQAPPLRQIYLTYPIEQLEGGFAEGMGSRHQDMPQIQFSPDDVAAILTYLGGVTGRDPSTRPRSEVPGETPP
ncbi:MAG TPA: cytochrome c [Methyloceanibacter sp.]|nr:cytochrome c [Methyloceanibacter sp.]